MSDIDRYYYDDGLRLVNDIPRVFKKAGNEVWGPFIIDGKRRKAHQVVWFMHHGEWVQDLDHKNRNNRDNRIENLRKATRAQQVINTRARGDLPKGVTRNHSRFMAQTKVGGKQIYLGTYDTPEEAHQAYVAFVGPNWGSLEVYEE